LYVSERSSAGRISAAYSSSRSVAAKPPFKPNCGFTPADGESVGGPEHVACNAGAPSRLRAQMERG
jgi:hypothetical protein